MNLLYKLKNLTTARASHAKWILIGSILIVLAYYLIDKPAVFYAYQHHLRQYYFLELFTRISEIIIGAVFFIYVIWLIRFYSGKNTYHDRALLSIANSVAIAAFINKLLKLIFSRYWAATWINNNPSLLSDHVYGFNWFHGGEAYASFPSGHMAVATAAAVAISLYYPRLRRLMFFIPVLTAIGLISLYYHFVSDVIAGVMLGYLVSSVAMSLQSRK